MFLIFSIIIACYPNNISVVEASFSDKLYLAIYDLEYGVKSFSGYVDKGIGYGSRNVYNATVYFTYKGKKYQTKTNHKGRFVFRNVPLFKHGTRLRINVKKKGYEPNHNIYTIKSDYSASDVWHYYSYPSTDAQRGYAEYVHRGDVLKITIGGYEYIKSFNNNRKKVGYSFNTGCYPAGTTIRFQLTTKYGKKLVDYTDIVYKKDKIYVGDSMEDVLLTAGFRKPSRKTYTAYGETWWYGSYKYVSFDADGRVSNWYL